MVELLSVNAEKETLLYYSNIINNFGVVICLNFYIFSKIRVHIRNNSSFSQYVLALIHSVPFMGNVGIPERIPTHNN